MAILDEYETGPERGPFFDSRVIDVTEVVAPQDSYLELHDLERLRDNITLTAALFNDNMSVYTRPLLLQQLEEELSELADSICQGDVLRMQFPTALTQRSSAHRNLVSVMGTPSSGRTGFEDVFIPTAKIQSIITQLGDPKINKVVPTLWLKVLTPDIQPSQMFTIDGLQDVPTQGRWLQFYLDDTEVALLTRFDSRATQ